MAEKSRMSVTLVGVLWALLSMIVSGVCSLSLLQPFWLLHPRTRDSLGVLSYCLRAPHSVSISSVNVQHQQQAAGASSLRCGLYGGHLQLSSLPSGAWQACCVLYGGGCCLLCVAALMALLSLYVAPPAVHRKLTACTGYVQTLAVVLLVSGLLVFPIGLDSKLARHYCEDSRMYSAGSCHVGWAYMLGMMGAALAVFCPFLSQYTDLHVLDARPKKEKNNMKAPVAV